MLRQLRGTNTSNSITSSKGRREDQRGEDKHIPSLRQDEHSSQRAARSCPPGGEATGEANKKTETKETNKTEQLKSPPGTGSLLATHQNEQDIFRKTEQTKTKTHPNYIRSSRSSLRYEQHRQVQLRCINSEPGTCYVISYDTIDDLFGVCLLYTSPSPRD